MLDRRDRVGLVGYGYWGQKLARNMDTLNDDPEGFDFVAIAESDRDTRILSAARHSHVKLYASIEEMIKEDDLTAVVIATPPKEHGPMAKYALEKGLDVLVEKPMAWNYLQALELQYICKTQGRKLMVDHTLCFDAMVQRFKRELDSRPRPFHIVATRINNAPEQLQKSDCNVIWDLAPHDLGVIDYLTNGRHGISVYASGNDSAAVLDITYEGGYRALVTVSWNGPDRQRNLVVSGRSFMLHYDAVANAMSVNNEIVSADTERSREPLLEMLYSFAGRNQSQMITDANHGSRVVTLLDAAHRSLKAERPVMV